MKIFSAKQLKEADKASLKSQEITSLELMERAAGRAFAEIQKLLEGKNPDIKIFCGIGNNGGDGLVIARKLLEQGYSVETYIVNCSTKRSPNFLENYERFMDVYKKFPTQIKSENDFPKIKKNELVIDAIFGIGLNRAPEGWVAKLLAHINAARVFVLSIDMPSGLFSNRGPGENPAVIQANLTLTFQSPKLAFFLPETAAFAGEFFVLDIGLDKEFLQKTQAEAWLITKNEVRQFYRGRHKFAHKGTFGHVLIFGGSYGKMGSVVMTSNAAFRAGCGKVTAVIPKCGYEIFQTAIPEAMAITSEEHSHLVETNIDFVPESICFGIGVGNHPDTVKAFEKILKSTTQPMLIDADGLNILSENTPLLKFIPPNSILTPHPKELERLLGKWKDDFDKLKKAKAFSEKYKVILVIKGAHSITVAGEKLYINSTGNPGMATAGSGDVLSGVITGLLAQGYNPEIAAVFGVYLHGKAGDFASMNLGFEAVMAGDISQNIGKALLDLFKTE